MFTYFHFATLEELVKAVVASGAAGMAIGLEAKRWRFYRQSSSSILY
ncbi:MAG: hypothetical protein AAGB46_04395 [Verrucomicrobiota bacterium]